MQAYIANTNQAVDRTIDLLNEIASTNAGMTVAEISRFLSTTRITAQSMINSLYASGYLEKSDSGKYTLGYRLYDIGNMYRYQFPFLTAAEKHMQRYAHENYRINVCVLRPIMATVILMSREHAFLSPPVFGNILPAYASASGKLLLAYQQPETVQEWLQSAPLKAFTPNTITDPQLLMDELEKIRQSGNSYSVGELILQRVCVAAPIHDMAGNIVASVSFSSMESNSESTLERMKDNINLLADMISAEAGYSRINF